MTSLFQLEEQIDALNALNKSSAKALDALADTSSSITTRANAILKDVRPWEVAQENIARTIEQMSKAARCYHPPACLPAVLARKDANPDSVAQCIDYLVYTHDYMSSHPVNRYAASIKSNTARQVQEIVAVSEDLVKRTFISALQPSKEVLTLTQNNQRGREQKMQLIRNPKALESIDLVIQRLGDNFNRLDVLLHDVKELLANRMAESVNAQFGGAYDREANGDGEATRVRSSYQTGSHPLLRVSAMSRSMAGDVSRCVQRYIIAPLGENYQVIEMPGELAQSIFDLVMSRAMDAIQVDAKRLTDITKLFVDLQGQGVEALGGARCFRDRVFLALDLIDELTKWKALAASLDGDNNQFIDYVDSVLETYLQSVRELLDTYASSRGELSASVLKSYATTTQRFEWVPSADCSVHEYSTNLMYFQKVILSSYSSALKHVFSSRGAHGTHAELKAMEALEFFFVQCMEGSIADLETMGRCAVSLQREALARGKPLKSSASHISGGNSVITSAEVFVLNNLLFFSDTYQRESCFSTCVVPAAPASTSPPASITARSVKMIDSAKQRILAAFGKSWAACFTDVAADAQLQTIKKSSEPLSKAQTEAIKQWYSKASAAVATKIANSQGQKVSELLTRRLLADSARQVVTAQFGRMKELLNGREWSKQPQKYLSPSEAEITERIRKLF